MTCFEFVPEQLEEMFDALACFFLGINVSSTVVFRRFAMLDLMHGFMDALDASVEGRTA